MSTRTESAGRAGGHAPARRPQSDPYLIVRAREVAKAYAFSLPALVLYGLFFLYPVYVAVRLSFHEWTGLSPLASAASVGFANYTALIHDSIFRSALVHTAIFTVVSVVAQTGLAFILAFSLWHWRMRLAGLQRMIIFFPTVLSMILVGLMWQQIFALDGPIDGPLKVNVAWLGNPHLVLGTIIWMSTWQWTGWYMMLYAAAMVGVPRDVLEAAVIDGASDARIAYSIVRPLVRPVTRLIFLLATIGAVQTFDTIWVTSRGGPFHTSETLTTYAYYAAFDPQGPGEFGTASAVAVVIIAALMLLAVLRIRLTREVVE